jgi:hypothetical protein
MFLGPRHVSAQIAEHGLLSACLFRIFSASVVIGHTHNHVSSSTTMSRSTPRKVKCRKGIISQKKNHVKIKIMNFSSGSLLNWKSLALRFPDFDSELEVISAILRNDGVVH